jgi:hypothetical protein
MSSSSRWRFWPLTGSTASGTWLICSPNGEAQLIHWTHTHQGALLPVVSFVIPSSWFSESSSSPDG